MYHAAGDSYPTAVLSSPELRQPIDAINGITVRPHRRSLFVCSVPRMSSPNPPCSFAADEQNYQVRSPVYSQAAQNVFDSYSNMFLATDWLRRAPCRRRRW